MPVKPLPPLSDVELVDELRGWRTSQKQLGALTGKRKRTFHVPEDEEMVRPSLWAGKLAVVLPGNNCPADLAFLPSYVREANSQRVNYHTHFIHEAR